MDLRTDLVVLMVSLAVLTHLAGAFLVSQTALLTTRPSSSREAWGSGNFVVSKNGVPPEILPGGAAFRRVFRMSWAAQILVLSAVAWIIGSISAYGYGAAPGDGPVLLAAGALIFFVMASTIRSAQYVAWKHLVLDLRSSREESPANSHGILWV